VRERRWRDLQPQCGAREVPLFSERDKIAKQAEFDVAHSQDVVNKAWWGFNDMSARYPRRSLLF
jgi:hypothetical protein